MYTHVSVYTYIYIDLYECVCDDSHRSWLAIYVPKYSFKGQPSASRLFVNTESKTIL